MLKKPSVVMYLTIDGQQMIITDQRLIDKILVWQELDELNVHFGSLRDVDSLKRLLGDSFSRKS
jgi:hypothetical protein